MLYASQRSQERSSTTRWTAGFRARDHTYNGSAAIIEVWWELQATGAMDVGTITQLSNLFPPKTSVPALLRQEPETAVLQKSGFFLGILHNSWMDEVQENSDHHNKLQL